MSQGDPPDRDPLGAVYCTVHSGSLLDVAIRGINLFCCDPYHFPSRTMSAMAFLKLLSYV